MRRANHLLWAFATAIGTTLPVSAATDPWTYEAVATHPRWTSFIQQLKDKYVAPVSEKRLAQLCHDLLDVTRDEQTGDPVDHCITIALSSLDRGESSYSPPKKFAEEKAASNKKFVGIGLELDGKKQLGRPMRVVQPIANGPGGRAGMLPGDDIIEVDGADVLLLTSSEVTNVMRGEAGTVMRLTLLRAGSSQPLKFAITREEIRIATVRSKWLTENIAYVRLSQMRLDTADALARKLATFQIDGHQQPKGLVVDLRLNPGGDFNAVVPIASQFVSKSTDVVSISDRNGVKTYRTESSLGSESGTVSQWQMSVPLVVLVDERTAGAAEAVAQFLREKRSASLLGDTTFGSPQIRTYLTLGDDAAMRLTTGRMTSPMGQGWLDGLAPDRILPPQSGKFEFADGADEWTKEAVIELRKRMAP